MARSCPPSCKYPYSHFFLKLHPPIRLSVCSLPGFRAITPSTLACSLTDNAPLGALPVSFVLPVSSPANSAQPGLSLVDLGI